MANSITGQLTRGSRRYNLPRLPNAATAGGDIGNIVANNLVLYLNAGDSNSYNGSGTTWYDLSTGSHDCVLVNGPVFNTGNGGYFDFDGVYDYGYVLNHTDFYFGTGEFTIEVWAMTEDISETYQILLGNHNAGVGGGWYFYGDYSDSMAFGYASQADDATFTQSQDTWYHFAVRRDANGIDFFRNNSAGSANLTFTDDILDPNNLDLIIGNLYYYNTVGSSDIFGWNGRIAQVRVYSRALSNAELTQNYDAHRSLYGL